MATRGELYRRLAAPVGARIWASGWGAEVLHHGQLGGVECIKGSVTDYVTTGGEGHYRR
jgi:hypothetical protein